ncbi:fumarylacetoacetate hydrolase family protein [Flavitalea antarctica]
MKLASYQNGDLAQAAVLINGYLYDTDILVNDAPKTMKDLLADWNRYYQALLHEEKRIGDGTRTEPIYKQTDDVELLAPVPFPPSCRDGYAFRQHVETARRNRKLGMIPEFDKFPIFYFTNHNSLTGPGKVVCMPDHFEKLDFELEAAIVISRRGRNIRAEDADGYMGGLMIMNDFSARRLQMEEMLLNLGPAKGKDFATATGPFLVTFDEFKRYETSPKNGHVGKNWNLTMICRVNGVQVSRGNLSDMQWTFAEIIERASYGVDLYPGDIIGSGTVGTGCFLELNGTGKFNNADYPEQWLQDGDLVELEIDGLGVLTNTIVAEDTSWSILQRNKDQKTDN